MAIAESVTLQWDPATGDDRVSGYEINYGTASHSYGYSKLASASGASTNNQVIDGLKPGSTYYFSVRSVGATASEVSAYSNEVSATIPDLEAPTVPTNLTAAAAGSSQISLSWTASTDNARVTGYQIERCQGAGCSAFAPIANVTGTSYTDSGLAAQTSYSYRVRANDAAGLTSPYSTASSATTLAGSVLTCSGTSIWASTAKPSIAADADSASVELGVKFKSDRAGFICGVRFYKGAGNTGTHVGRLWSKAGKLLAQATFTAESTSGWQQVNFSAPVAIAANTVYVASYLAPKGHYAVTANAFATAGVDRAPLHALKNGISGGNGVYRYGTGGFPASSYKSSNYWVDVVYTATLPMAKAASTRFMAESSLSETLAVEDSRVAEPETFAFESAEVSVGNEWLWVEFKNGFTDPVVIANAPSENTANRALVRIREVNEKGFWVRLEGWNEDILENAVENVGYIAIERGRHQLENGSWLEAGRLSMSQTNAFQRVPFADNFSDAPVVLTSVTTENAAGPLATRIRSIDNQGFNLGIRQPENNRQPHESESVDYIAWEISAGELNGRQFNVERAVQSGDAVFQTIVYPSAYSLPPVLVAGAQSGNEPGLMSWRNKDVDAVDLAVEQGMPKGNENTRAVHRLGYVLIEPSDDSASD